MKVRREQAPAVFIPITITLETEEEALVLYQCVARTSEGAKRYCKLGSLSLKWYNDVRADFLNQLGNVMDTRK